MANPNAAPAAEPVDQTPDAPEKPAKHEPTGLAYRGDGDLHFGSRGVPARDLTVAELLELEPAVFRQITAPNPSTGKALYETTKAGTAAWEAARG